MTVFEVKGQLNEIGPGVCGSEAEAKVAGPDGEEVFVYAQCFEDCYNFGVYGKSIYGTMDNGDAIEQYDELGEAEKSEYHPVFAVLDRVLRLIEG